jgi:periplasmic copper chaperone A
MVRALIVMAAVALGTACTQGMPEITIAEQDAKISPIIVGSGSVFMRIDNTGRGNDALIGAKTSIPGTIVELHDIDEGKMIVRGSIPIPSKSTVQLRPYGYHLMIFRMPKDVKEGCDFTLTLVFERSGEKQVPLQFTPIATKPRHPRNR